MRCPSHAFDNCRFFLPMSEGGAESGSQGWVRITVAGRREYLQSLDPDRAALVVVDMQDGCVEEWPAALAAHDPALADAFTRRMSETVIPNHLRLLEFFRAHGLPVVFLVLGKRGKVLKSLEPREGEPVLHKFSSGAFATSALDIVLREWGAATLFFTGTDTAGCVCATMSGAYDRSYQTILIEDACCGSRPELHEAAVAVWAYKGFVRTTGQVLDDYPWTSWLDPGPEAVT